MREIKLDENKNPYLPNKKLLKKLRSEMFEIITQYPDIDNSKNLEKIASLVGIEKDNICITNGSMSAFDFLTKQFNDVVYGEMLPTFWGFKYYLYLNEYKKYFSSEFGKSYAGNLKKLQNLAIKCNVVYLCNRNNPTLDYFEKEDLLDLVTTHANCHFIIDETLLTYENDFLQKSLFREACTLPNLTVVTSLSKFFGVAGLRIGTVISNKKTIQEISKFVSPYSTSKLAQKTLGYILDNTCEICQIKNKIFDNYQYLCENIDRKYVTKIVNDNSCFIMISLADKIDLKQLQQIMQKNKIALRYSFELINLKGNWLRLSAGTKKQYHSFISVFNRFSKGV